MQINKTSFAAGVGSAVLLGAALVPGLVGAQTPDASPSTADAGGDALQALECGPRLGAVGLRISEDLAAALGVTTEELKAAVESVRESYADAERPATEEEHEARQAELQAALATALGISVEDLETAKEALKAEHQAEAIARVNEKVADGTLTQEEADAIIERIESGEHRLLEGRPGPIGPGGPGGRGFGRFERFERFGDFGGLFGSDEAAPSVTPDA